MAMTIEQERALALARARRRRAEGSQAPAAAAQDPIATTPDGGRIYRGADGSMSFASPGFSTTDQATIARIMKGATPVQANTERNVDDGGRLGAAARSALQGATFGFGDEIVGGGASLLTGRSYETELQRERARLSKGRDAYPGTSVMSELAGAVALPVGAVGPMTAGTKLAPYIGTTGARLVNGAGTLAKSAAVGGAMGGVYGFGSGEGSYDKRVESAQSGAAIGGLAGAAAPILGRIVERVANNVMGRNAITRAAANAPTSEALRAQGKALYQQVDDAGVQIAPKAFDRMRGDILDNLRANTGFDELPGPGSLTPNAARVNQIMDEASGIMAKEPRAALPFRSLDQMRRQAGAAAGNVANKADQAAGMEIIGGIDDFVNRLGPGDVLAGDISALQTALPKARETWSRMTRSQIIDDAIEAGQGNYLSGGSSGIRNQFKNILNNKKLAAKFSDAEKAAMRRVINGSFPERLLNMGGSGLGWMVQIGTGGVLGGPVGAVVGAGTGYAARRASEALSASNAETVRAMIANGGIAALPTVSPATRAVMDGIIRRAAIAGGQDR